MHAPFLRGVKEERGGESGGMKVLGPQSFTLAPTPTSVHEQMSMFGRRNAKGRQEEVREIYRKEGVFSSSLSFLYVTIEEFLDC
mmetsp:Transcript_26310/g.51710  ORF Transcript_26310/g.51710 Transcript_26310/m.51710 type:complete len:84 (-) Transcript_26310:150-401(-)